MKAEINRIARLHHARKVYVFGSCARREETPKSDVDILADFSEKASLFDQVNMQLALADMLQCKVDVIPSSALRDPVFGSCVQKDMILL